MLLLVEKGIRGGISHAIHRYVKANNKYLKNYDRNIESSYIMYLDAKNLCGSYQNWSVNGFKWMKILWKFHEDFVKNYKENSSKEYILEVDVDYLRNLILEILFNLHNDLQFLPKRKI